MGVGSREWGVGSGENSREQGAGSKGRRMSNGQVAMSNGREVRK